MIRFVERIDIDDQKWDRCIRDAFNGNLYGYSWYLDIVSREWGALIEDDYERIFPLVYRKRFGFQYIYQPFFTQQLGLYSRKQLNSEILGQFLRAIPGRFRMAEINLNTLNKADENDFRLVPQLNHELDLINSYDRIGSGYTENLARNLKKAEKAGLTISRSIKPDDVVRIFRDNRGRDIVHLKEADYSRLRRIAYTCMYKGIADIWGVFDRKNQLCAGAFFFTINRKAVFLFSGLTPEGRDMGAMPFLIDSFIRENAGKHITFDFDGSNDLNLAKLYRSFGSRECIYQRIYLDRFPKIIGIAVRIYRGLKDRKIR